VGKEKHFFLVAGPVVYLCEQCQERVMSGDTENGKVSNVRKFNPPIGAKIEYFHNSSELSSEKHVSVVQQCEEVQCFCHCQAPSLFLYG
jgi:hypothetical protein